MSARPPYGSLALLSASALAYEVLLMRLFSIIQWHHFAYLVIALALLGYGLSGTLLWIAGQRATTHYAPVYVAAILLFALSAVGAYLLAQSIDFNIEELLWNRAQSGRLALLFLLLSLPFLFAAGAVCLTFMAYPEARTASIYAFDLLGAGLGSLGIIGLLTWWLPERVLLAIGLAGLAAAAVAIRELRPARYWAFTGVTAAFALILLAAAPAIGLIYSPYKSLAQTLQIRGVEVLDTRSSPLGYLTVVASEQVPLRQAPGLSLVADRLPPPQLGLFTDADNLSAIDADTGSPEGAGYLDQTTAALPYHLRRPERLLVVGSGTGGDVRLARYHQVPRIDALELNPQVIELVDRHFADYAGAVYRQPGVSLHIAEARDFLSRSDARYDLLQLALVDAAGASATGLYALNESYLYTREAMALYLDHLAPGGYLAITRWIKLPPRDTLKLFATAIEALKAAGLPEPERRLALIRSWQTGTLLVKNGTFTDTELTALARFCDARLFDTVYTPRLTENESNRYNRLDDSDFFTATQALAKGDAEALYAHYKFDLRPATDDRPYFHHFFKWRSFLEALSLRGQGGLPLIEWGYVILLFTLALTLAAGALLILAPLALLGRRPEGRAAGAEGWRVMLYFFCIGLAFLFIEIAFIQRFLRFLHHPIYTIAVTLTAFLIFAGLGSLSSRSLGIRLGVRPAAELAFAGIALLSLLYLLSLGWLFSLLGGLSMGARIVLTLLLIAPLAFLMGLPFPLALTQVKREAATLVPWAWGVNGYASVISASLATLMAIHFGFSAVVAAAMAIYLTAWRAFPGRQ